MRFRCNPFNGLTYTFDPVLKLGSIGRKKARDLVAANFRRGKSGLGKINDLPDAELVARHDCHPRPLTFAPS